MAEIKPEHRQAAQLILNKQSFYCEDPGCGSCCFETEGVAQIIADHCPVASDTCPACEFESAVHASHEHRPVASEVSALEPKVCSVCGVCLQFVCPDCSRPALAASQAEAKELRGALDVLVSRLRVIHEDPRYKSVWQLYALHGGVYIGPSYKDQLDGAESVLKRWEGK
jgi:hypothetical protein